MTEIPLHPPTASAAASVATLLVRAADCLTALLRSPTAAAGLNESRYNVLDALRRIGGGATQSELAARLLQSESNLSTLLDRMHHDGLISRVRSETDRRKSLIRLSPSGSEMLLRADHERHIAAARFLGDLDGDRRDLGDALGRLLQRLERELGILPRNASSAPRAATPDHHGPHAVPAPHVRQVDSSRILDNSPISNGHTP